MQDLKPLRTNITGIRRMPEAYKIKTGEKGDLIKTASGATMHKPKKLGRIKVAYPYFDPTTNQFPEVPEFRDRKNLKELAVWPVSDNVEDFCISFFAFYQGRALYCYGDGQDAHCYERINKNDQSPNAPRVWTSVPCNRETCKHAKPNARGVVECKLHMKAAFALHPDTVMELAPLGVLRSTSLLTHDNVTGYLEKLRAITGGMLRGIPLTLVHYETEFGRHGVEVLRLEYRGSYQALAEAIQERKRNDALLESARGGDALPIPTAALDPQLETPEEQANVADEFAPENGSVEEISWTIDPPSPAVVADEIPIDATEEQELAATEAAKKEAPKDKFDLS